MAASLGLARSVYFGRQVCSEAEWRRAGGQRLSRSIAMRFGGWQRRGVERGPGQADVRPEAHIDRMAMVGMGCSLPHSVESCATFEVERKQGAAWPHSGECMAVVGGIGACGAGSAGFWRGFERARHVQRHPGRIGQLGSFRRRCRGQLRQSDQRPHALITPDAPSCSPLGSICSLFPAASCLTSPRVCGTTTLLARRLSASACDSPPPLGPGP